MPSVGTGTAAIHRRGDTLDFSSADSFRAGCVQMLENCTGLGLNTVLAQVRPFGDALYKSQLFPWSHLCTGVQGQDPGFDPLDILLQEAHGRGLSVEAWLNPYRLRSSAAMPPNLAENNLANTHPEWVCAVGDGHGQSSVSLSSFSPAR